MVMLASLWLCACDKCEHAYNVLVRVSCVCHVMCGGVVTLGLYSIYMCLHTVSSVSLVYTALICEHCVSTHC